MSTFQSLLAQRKVNEGGRHWVFVSSPRLSCQDDSMIEVMGRNRQTTTQRPCRIAAWRSPRGGLCHRVWALH